VVFVVLREYVKHNYFHPNKDVFCRILNTYKWDYIHIYDVNQLQKNVLHLFIKLLNKI